MERFQFTAQQWADVSETLDRWADVMETHAARQFRGHYFGGVVVDGDVVVGMCVLGALHVAATGEYPRHICTPFDNWAIHRRIHNRDVLDLVAQTAARQCRIPDFAEKVAIGDDPLRYLNDEVSLSFMDFARASRDARAVIAEHAVITDAQTIPVAVRS